MADVHSERYWDALNAIERLPEPEQISIIHAVQHRIERKSKPRRRTAHLALGYLATGSTPPTDAEVERILVEERMKKFGK